ncbi:MAG: hypothetical protein C4318_01510 [Acidimicrobiia bacterium]
MIEQLPPLVGLTALLQAAVRISTPVSLAAIGESVLERSGVVNVGLEAMMLMGAFAGFATASLTGSLGAGTVGGVATGAVMGLGFGAMVNKAKANAIASGVALNLLALGLTATAMRRLYPGGTAPFLSPLHPIRVPMFADIPFLGKVLFVQSPFFYAMALSAAGTGALLWGTKHGLRIRAAGEMPEALLFSGLRPESQRMRAAVLCGALAGLGGSQLSIDIASTFTEQATAGRGFVALAIVLIGRRDPRLVPLASLVYGIAEAYTLRLISSGTGMTVSISELLPGLPFALTLGVYAIASLSSKRRSAPA